MSGCLRLGQEEEERSTAVAVPDASHLGVLGDPNAYPRRLGGCLKADERLLLWGKVRIFGLRGIYWVLNKLEDERTACVLSISSEYGCPAADTENEDRCDPTGELKSLFTKHSTSLAYL